VCEKYRFAFEYKTRAISFVYREKRKTTHRNCFELTSAKVERPSSLRKGHSVCDILQSTPKLRHCPTNKISRTSSRSLSSNHGRVVHSRLPFSIEDWHNAGERRMTSRRQRGLAHRPRAHHCVINGTPASSVWALERSTFQHSVNIFV